MNLNITFPTAETSLIHDFEYFMNDQAFFFLTNKSSGKLRLFGDGFTFGEKSVEEKVLMMCHIILQLS